MAFLQYLRLLRQTVLAATRTYNLQQTMATGYISYDKKWYEGTWLGCHNVNVYY